MSDAADLFARFWDDLLTRPTGPLALRFSVQPVLAAVFAIPDGIGDAHGKREPNMWSALQEPDYRRGHLHEGWFAAGKAFLLGLVIDFVYQSAELDRVRLSEALVVAVLLAVVPYFLIRGLTARTAWWFKRKGDVHNGTHLRTG